VSTGTLSASTPACARWPHEPSVERCPDRCDGAFAAVSDDRAASPGSHCLLREHGVAVVTTATTGVQGQPRVSVVIPCYNGGSFLREAIESVLHQTSRAAEIVVVNDGSTDDTAAVARSYEQVRYVEQRNQGASAARNTGMRSSTGDLLVFLDADDRLQPHALATGVDSLAANPEWAFVSGDVRVIAEDGSTRYVPEPRPRSGDPYIQLLRSNYIWTPGVVMYRRDILRAVNGYVTWAGASADYELNVRIARGFPIGRHYQVILDYRQHPSSMSTDVRYMLKSAVTVRRAERRHACRTAEGKLAWQEGIASVQSDYGSRLLKQMKSDLGMAGRRGRAVLSLWYVARYYPAGLIRLARGLLRRAAARLR
jgi:glycosyltransferase involved in cell wall biosynthesis